MNTDKVIIEVERTIEDYENDLDPQLDRAIEELETAVKEKIGSRITDIVASVTDRHERNEEMGELREEITNDFFEQDETINLSERRPGAADKGISAERAKSQVRTEILWTVQNRGHRLSECGTTASRSIPKQTFDCALAKSQTFLW